MFNFIILKTIKINGANIRNTREEQHERNSL